MKTCSFPLITQTLLLAGVISVPAVNAADDANFNQRLQQLEKQVQALVQENTELKKQLGWDGKKPLNLVEDKGKAASVQLGGYIQGQVGIGGAPDARFTGANENNSFTLRRARFNVSGKFLENFDFKLEGDFGGTGTSLRAQLTDGYINWNRYDFANLKVGQFKTPFGYEQLVADTGTLTIERSYPNDRLTVGRQLGVGASGSLFDKRLSYSAGVFNGNNVNNGMNDSDDFLYAGRVEGVPVKTKLGGKDFTWSIGANGLYSDDQSVSLSGYGFRTNPTGAANNTFAGTRDGFAADTQLSWGRFGLQAEYFWMNFHPEDGNFTASPLDDDFVSQGFYVSGTAFIIPKKLEAIVKYESLETEDNVGSGDADVWTFGLSYYLKGHDLKIMANYLWGDPENGDEDGRFLVRLQVAF